MKKIYFSKLRGSILLMLFMMCALIGFSQGTDDFSTLTATNNYQTNTTTGGWQVVNSSIGAPTTTSPTIGSCGRQHVVMNGKTSAVGSITSPTITGGCGTLSFTYANVYSEQNGAKFTVKLVNPEDNTNILYDTTVVVVNSDMGSTGTLHDFLAEVNVAADFVLVITNNSPSNSTSNKDRLAIGCIEWTAYTAPIEPTWVTCDQVGIFNTQVVGLVPTCSVVGDSTVYHFVYNSDFTQYPYQTPNQDWGADGNKIYVDVAVARPNADVTGVMVSFGPGTEHVVTFGNVLDPNNGTLGADRYAALRYFPVATVIDGVPVGNTTQRNWTATFEWYTDTILVAIQKLNVVVDAAPTPEATWVTCDQVGTFNTQVDGLVPTCSTVGDSTVYHFSYTDDFTQYPFQTPNQDWGADGNKIYVDVAVARPNENITAVKVSYGGNNIHIISFGDVLDPNNGTLGAPRYAALRYFPVATVVGGEPVGNATQRNWTATYEWYAGASLVSVQKLNVVVDAAPAPLLPYDTVAELPYTYNFDDGRDRFLMIDNGTATNEWYIGQAQGFEDNKLYISSNNGTTNKYDITAASNVIAYRDVMIPAAGAILSFDYRVNGEANYDYLQVSLEHGNEATPIAQLSGENEWNTFSYDISGEMAGVVRIKFQWINDESAGDQFPAAIDNIAVIETPCSQPTALTADVDSTNALISWVAAEGQTAWTFQYKLADHIEWYTMNVTEASSVSLSDLQGNSNYDMRVQAVCGEYTSAWTTGTFAVACQTEIVIAEQEDIVIGTGTSANTTTCIFPGYYGWQYGAHLYEMENTNAKHTIHSIAFYLNAASSTTGSTMTVWVKAVDGDYALAASNTFNGMLEGAQQIYDGAPDFSTAGWMTFPVENFSLAAGQNLLVLVRGVGCSTSGGCSKSARYTSATNKMWYNRQDTNDPGQEVAGTLSSYRANITINATISTCSDPIDCVNPSNLTVDNVTANSAELTWTAGDENQTAFIVECMAEGATGWTSVDVNDTTYTLTDLAQLTYYFVRVKANCGDNNWSDVITASFRTEGICAPVTDLETANVSNSTTLTWTAGGEETAWLVQFKPAVAGDDAWTSIDVNLIPMTTFGGLEGNTDYDLRVKALCNVEDPENQSEWAYTMFHSGCAAFEIPYVQDLKVSTMPTCWENEGFSLSSGMGINAHTDGAYLITPAFNIPAENSTYLVIRAYGYSGGDYTVLASYRGTRADRFAEIYTGTVTSTAEDIIIPIADLYKGRAVNFKIVNNGTTYKYFEQVEINQCPFVATDLAAGNATDTTIDLAWSADEAATNFQVQYGVEGFTLGEGIIIDVLGDTAVTVDGLTFETTYDFYVRVVCEGDNGEWVGPVSASTALSCSAPEITEYELYENSGSVMVFWTPGEWGTPMQYNVRYRAEGDEEYTTEVVEAPTAFITISGLQSMTTYEIGVQSICGVDKESNWATIYVTTSCMPTSTPYTENFDSYTGTTSQSTMPMPNCWTRKFTGTNTSYGAGIYNNSNYAVTGPNSLRMYNYCTTNTTSASYGNLYVVLPQFVENINELMLSFEAKKYNSTSAYYISNFEVGVVTDNENPETTFTPFTTVSVNTYPTATKIDIPFDSYNGVDGYIAFRMLKERPEGYTNNYAYNYVFIDNLAVGPIPTCFVPSIAVSGTTATITPNTNGNPAESYNLKIGEEIANTTSTTVDLATLFSLTAQSDYEVSVQAVCGEGDESEWSDALAFTTPCDPYTIPYFEGFENGYTDQAAVAGCLTQERVSGSYSWIANSSLTNYNRTPRTGSWNAYLRWSNTSWLYIPVSLEANKTYLFSMYARQDASSGCDMKVSYGNTPEASSMTSEIVPSTSIPSSFTELAGTFTVATTGTYYVGIYAALNSTPYYVSIDDISIISAPTCGVPSISVDGTIATITPNSIGTPESYDLQIGDEIVNVTADTVDLMAAFTLDMNTNYEVSVRSICGDNDESEWSEPVSFKTPVCEGAVVVSLDGTETNSYLPTYVYYNYSYTQQIYESTDVNVPQGGQITSVSFEIASGSVTRNIDVYMMHSNATSFTGSTSWLDITSATLVYSGEVAFASGWNLISLTTPFDYNGTDNLVVIVDDNTGSWVSSPSWGTHSTSESKAIRVYSDDTNYDPFNTSSYSGTVMTSRNNIKFSVCPLPTCFVPTNLTVSDINDNSAVLTWAANGNNPDTVNYIVEYKGVGEDTWQTATVSDLTYTLTNLIPSNDYTVRVKTDCGNDDESMYATAEFSTLCPYGYYEGTQLICPEAEDLQAIAINTFADACEVDGNVTITVKNLGYEPVSAFTAYYQVNGQEVVSEAVELTTPLALSDEITYEFSNLPVFEDGINTISAWVIADNNENAQIVSTTVTILTPATVPYVEDFAGLTINHGWNPIDANHDGITMGLNNNINYTYNDELAADDWMMSPCIEMPAGTYTISYDYMANSSLTESFEVFYGNGAHIADMTNALAAHTFNNTAWETVTNTIEITEAGVYNFGFHATSLAGNLGFAIDNLKIYPVNDVTITYAENGTVTPEGIVAVNYGENLTLNIVPDPMYHVGGIWVDDVQVVPEDGNGSNFMLYTLENVTEPHTVFVDFKLEFHIIKTVENYNPSYEDFGGTFVPAATDTTINPDPFTVNMVADPHYFLSGLTISPMVPDMPEDVFADVIDNGDRTYSYTIDTLVVANYYLNATFRRDTVDINYTVLTGKGYADDSQMMDGTDATNNTYTTWIDYSVNNDVFHTSTFAPAENYHIVDVIVNGESQGRIDSYDFSDVTETQQVDIKYGYMITTSVSNFNTYDDIQEPQGKLVPDTQYVAEYNSMWVVGSVEEHFHLYQLLVNGVDRIDEVVFLSDPHYYFFTMDSVDNNYHIEAVVKVDTFAITYNVIAGQGYADESNLLDATDTIATYTNYHNYGDYWYSNIVPATGYSIYNVDLDGQNLYTASNYQFNYIVESHEFTVSFAPNTYTITTNAYGNGTVSEGAQFIYTPDAPFNYDFTATAAEGYYIASITINNEAVDLTGVEDTYTTTIENVADNYTINVIFQMYTYTMTGGAGFGGNITPSGSQTVNYGTDLLYEIVAEEGYYIETIYVDGELVEEYTQEDGVTAENVSFTAIDADHEVYATFAEFVYTISGIVGEHGTVNGATTINEQLSYGSNYTLTITPDENYQVADVVIDGISMGAITSYEFINVTADHNVVVTFEATMYTLTASTNIASCTITPATTTVQAGSDVIYTVTPATGYHLVSVTANGVEIIVPGNTFTIEDVQGDIEIYAIFASNNVTVTVDQPAHATIAPGTMMYAYGATPSYTIVPEVGYEVVNVTAGNAIVNVTYNNGIGYFTLDALVQDITLTATTAIKTYTITVTQGANGTIAPATQTGVEYGSSRTFTITPNDYYVVADVIVDGSSRGQLSSYTFYNVTGNHTITAVFEANCQTPTNLTAFDIDTTSAVVSWVGNATSYEVRYKTADDADYTTQTVSATTLALTGLTPNTLYSWGVRAVCGTSMYSDWASNAFTTKALPVEPVVGIANADLSSIKVYSYLNNVYVVNEEGIAISNIDIYDIYGKQVYTGKVINSPEVISLNVANGNYVVRLATDNGIGVYKVAIVR